MVKSIIIDDGANKLLENVLDKKAGFTNTGLIIGALDDSNDYIVYIIPTPPCTESKNIDQDWIVNHGLQIHDMLVGGIDILGLYCVDMTAAIGKQILLKLYRTLDDLEYYKKMNFNKDRLLFLVDSTSKKINMKSLNYIDSKATLQICKIDVKPNLFNEEFYQLNSNLSLDTSFKTPNVKSYNLTKEDLQTALVCDELFNSKKFICLINSNLVEENISFSQCQGSLQNGSSKEFEVSLLENLTSEIKAPKRIIDSNLESIYKLSGVCYLTVLFHKSSLIGNMKRMLVYDLLRSFNARVRLLVEDLDARKDIIGDEQLDDPDSDEGSSIEESYQTPNRIRIHMPRNIENTNKNELNFLICDYVFPDENSMDISDRIKQLFNHEIDETQIYYVEKLPPDIKRNSGDLESVSDDGLNHLNKKEINSKTRDSSNTGLIENTKYLLGALATGLLAIAVYYLSIQQEINTSNKKN